MSNLGIQKALDAQAQHAAVRFAPWHLSDDAATGHVSAADAWDALDAADDATGATVWDRQECVWVGRDGATHKHLEDARDTASA